MATKQGKALSGVYVPLLASDDPAYRRRWRTLAAFLVLVPLILFLVTLHKTLGALWDPATWAAIAAALKTVSTADLWVNGLTFFVALPVAIIVIKLSNRRVIRINERHIAMTGALWNTFLGQELNWTLRWTEINEAWIENPPLAGGAAFLVLNGRKKYRINLVQWVPADFRWPRGRGLADFVSQMMPPWHKDPEASPLVKQVESAGVTLAPLPKPRHFGQTQFDLMSDLPTRILTGLMMALLIYGGLDLMFGSEQYVGNRPFLLMASIAALATLGAWLFARSGAAPASVTILIAILVGCSAGFAAYPGLLRVNAVLDPGGLQSVEYQRVAGAQFAPTQGRWPVLNFPDQPYWTQLEGDLIRSISIRRGGLGIVQVDFRSLYPEIHDYYTTH